jgi:glycosyltransferase involved in cell wall biosynthesis
MRICLFDWNEGGHHAEVAKAFAAALQPGAEVVLAAADPTLESVGDTPAETFSLGAARPRPESGDAERSKSELAERELDLVEDVVRQVEPDHLVLLWADPVLRWLLRRPPLPTAVSLYVAFARLHYPRRFRTPLGLKGWASALYKEMSLLRWSRRRDAHALFALDPLAAERWRRYPGVRAYGLDETPLNHLPKSIPADEKEGCILFGHMDERKGVDLIAAALAEGCEGLGLRIYGEPVAEFEDRLQEEIGRMRDGGVEVDARLRRLPYEEAMEGMARSRAALLSFGWVPAGSRVLLEAAAAGTPAIGSTQGAVGYLIRSHGLGVTVDPGDARALRTAIQDLALGPDAPQRYAERLRAYARRLDGEAYRREVRRAFGLPS